MCWEDKLIGRASGGFERIATLSTGSTELVVPASDRRIVLVFVQVDAAIVTVSTTDPVVSGRGLQITDVSGPVVMTIEEYGSLVTKAWYGIPSITTRFLTIYEVTLPLEKPNGGSHI